MLNHTAKTTEKFIEDARKIHGDKYDYSKVEYVNNHTEVCIICKEHGDFWQTPNNHLSRKGCPKCKGLGFSNEERILKAKEIHGDKYDYSKSDFTKSRNKTIISCPIHGDFWMTYDRHVNQKKICPRCSKPSQLTPSEFEERANKVHNGQYSYIQDYRSMHEKVTIICPIHGKYEQRPLAHLRGQGCPKCSKKNRLEEEIKTFLLDNEMEFEEQKRFEWLGLQSLDFFIPKCNVAIECQGKQHFGEGGWIKDEVKREEYFEIQRERDKRKFNLCNEHGIEVLYFSNMLPKGKYLGEVFTDKEKIKEKIIKRNIN